MNLRNLFRRKRPDHGLTELGTVTKTTKGPLLSFLYDGMLGFWW